MLMKQRSYLDGKLSRTSQPREAEIVRKWLDNVERDWSKDGMFPLTPAGQFDLNKAHEVTRVSVDELHITSTSGRKLRFINVEVK